MVLEYIIAPTGTGVSRPYGDGDKEIDQSDFGGPECQYSECDEHQATLVNSIVLSFRQLLWRGFFWVSIRRNMRTFGSVDANVAVVLFL